VATVITICINVPLIKIEKEQVRQETVKYCVEKPKDCALEQQYFQLKETQRK